MEVLSSVSVFGFKVGIWLLAIAVGLFAYIGDKRRKGDRYKQILAAVKSLYVAAYVFALASLSTMFYIMSHATDPRWSEGKNPLLNPDEASSDIPVVRDIMNAFNDLQGTVTGVANNAISIQNAFATIPEFFHLFFWAAVTAACLKLVLWRLAIHDQKRDARLAAVAERERKEKEDAEKKEIARRLDRQAEAVRQMQRDRGIDPWEDL